MNETKLFVAMKACIINEKNQILIVRESDSYKDGSQVGKWDVPGGRINPDETLEEALRREVKEETNLILKSYTLLDVHDTFANKHNEKWHIVRLFYITKCEEGIINLSKDHDAYDWVDVDKITAYPGIIQNMMPTLIKLNEALS
ncbi:MAG: 7,8-dihydro-8-oxoguanine triphosphatase [Candidatus Nomurabacteria bacterium]|nr:7,8-dihydro-8-oxoguanine triphosphatase [Candidatus Nomurabacteria bacterium]